MPTLFRRCAKHTISQCNRRRVGRLTVGGERGTPRGGPRQSRTPTTCCKSKRRFRTSIECLLDIAIECDILEESAPTEAMRARARDFTFFASSGSLRCGTYGKVRIVLEFSTASSPRSALHCLRSYPDAKKTLVPFLEKPVVRRHGTMDVRGPAVKQATWTDTSGVRVRHDAPTSVTQRRSKVWSRARLIATA